MSTNIPLVRVIVLVVNPPYRPCYRIGLWERLLTVPPTFDTVKSKFRVRTRDHWVNGSYFDLKTAREALESLVPIFSGRGKVLPRTLRLTVRVLERSVEESG